MAVVSCPKCSSPTIRGGYPVWVILVAIFLFPFGLLALLAGRRPTQCPQCGFIWQP
jgi:DNA-directed RNA polymerase subunit RPC12/RpoP